MITTNNRDAHSGPEVSPIDITCPDCGNRYRLAVTRSETLHFHCVACDTRFSVQQPMTTTSPATEAEDPPSATPTATADTPSPAIVPQRDGMDTCTPDASEGAPPPPPPVRLWPWLMILLLIVAALGSWVNLNNWSRTPLIQSMQAWWAPQRSIGWGITRTEPQWINRQDAPPLLVIGLRLRNQALFDRPPPPLLLTPHIRGRHQPDDAQQVTLYQQPSLIQLEQPSWHPPAEDRTPIPAGGARSYTIVLDKPPRLLESVEITLH